MTTSAQFTVNQVKKRLNISHSTFYRRVREGEIKTYTWHGRTYIRADHLEALLARISGRAGGGDRDVQGFDVLDPGRP